jgi:hypothetical protein
MGTLETVRRAAPAILDDEGAERALKTADELLEILRTGRKSLRWKLRAQVGERVRWYELPEEVQQ